MSDSSKPTGVSVEPLLDRLKVQSEYYQRVSETAYAVISPSELSTLAIVLREATDVIAATVDAPQHKIMCMDCNSEMYSFSVNGTIAAQCNPCGCKVMIVPVQP